MRSKWLGILPLLGMSCFGAPINLWVDDALGNIGQVDIATGAVTFVGNSGVVLTDIGFSPTGALYGVSFNSLYRVNTTTGAATLIGSLGSSIATANALVFSSTGTLYTADSANLYTVNTTTGAASLVGAMGFGSGGDLAFDGGSLYLASSADQLVRLNTSTGAGTLIGNFGVSSVFGLASPDNVNLYAVAGQNIYSINLTTGLATFDTTWAGNVQGLSTANGESFFAEATTGAAPEPAAFLLTGLGLLLLGIRSRLPVSGSA